MSGWLPRILAGKRAELALLRDRATTNAPMPRRDVRAELARSPGAPLRLIAEIKRRSPSAGALSTVLSVGERAVAYAESGAAMISVLCDTGFFDGGFEHLGLARRALDAAGFTTPLLAKEFVIDPVQVRAARAAGADAVLLIVRIVTPDELKALLAETRAVGLEALVEVTDSPELEIALEAGAELIGVNARDLDTLAMDAARAERVLRGIPPSCVRAHLSGIKDPDAVRAVAAANVDAALIGEALMREDDPRGLLGAMVAAGA